MCGTDLHIFEGSQPYFEYPRVIGHELAGEIAAVEGPSRFRVGQPVAVIPYVACGQCVACRRGKPNCCQRLNVIGVHSDGGFADWLTVPEDNLVDAEGVSLDAGGDGRVSGDRRACGSAAPRSSRGQKVLVVGAGPIGLATAIFARARGGEVTMLDTRADRLAFARQAIGLDQAIEADEGARERCGALTGGDFFDCVFDCTGSPKAMNAGFFSSPTAGPMCWSASCSATSRSPTLSSTSARRRCSAAATPPAPISTRCSPPSAPARSRRRRSPPTGRRSTRRRRPSPAGSTRRAEVVKALIEISSRCHSQSCSSARAASSRPISTISSPAGYVESLGRRRIAVVQTTASPDSARRIAFFDAGAPYRIHVRGLVDGAEVDAWEEVDSIGRGVDANLDWAAAEKLFLNARWIVSNTGDRGYELNADDRVDNGVPRAFPAKLTKLLYSRFAASRPAPTLFPAN